MRRPLSVAGALLLLWGLMPFCCACGGAQVFMHSWQSYTEKGLPRINHLCLLNHALHACPPAGFVRVEIPENGDELDMAVAADDGGETWDSGFMDSAEEIERTQKDLQKVGGSPGPCPLAARNLAQANARGAGGQQGRWRPWCGGSLAL